MSWVFLQVQLLVIAGLIQATALIFLCYQDKDYLLFMTILILHLQSKVIYLKDTQNPITTNSKNILFTKYLLEENDFNILIKENFRIQNI